MSVDPTGPSNPIGSRRSLTLSADGHVITACDCAAFVALVGAMAVLPLQGVRVGGRVGLTPWMTVNAPMDRASGYLVSDVLLVAAAAFGAIVMASRGREVAVPRLVRWGLLAMAVGGTLGVIVAADRGPAFALLMRLAVVIVVSLIAIWGTRPAGRRGRFVAAAYIVGASISAAVGALAVRAEGLSRFETPLGRAVGLAGNSGALAVMSVIGLALAVMLALESSGRIHRAALVGAAAVLALSVLDSGARGALLGLMVIATAIVVRAWHSGRRRFALAVSGALLAVAVVCLAGALHLRAVDRLLLRDDRATNEVTRRSTELRVEQYRLQLRDRGWQSLLIGSGLQDLEPTRASMEQEDLRDPHNGHLEVWLGMGLLGVTGWALIAAATTGPGARLLTAARPLREDEALLAAVGTAYLAFLALALTVNNVTNRYLWLLVAWASWLSSRSARSVPPTQGPGPGEPDRSSTPATRV